jgi:hypothetical protein
LAYRFAGSALVVRGCLGDNELVPTRSTLRRLTALRDPVVPILLLAGIFDWLSGNPIHSVLLFAAAFALAWELAFRREDRATFPAGPFPLPPRWLLIMTGVLFAVLIGEFGRYSWPATAAILVPAAAGLFLGWRESPRPPLAAPTIRLSGVVAWAGVFVSLALWELAALLLQPSLTTDSNAHPTISVLTDAFLATHIGRSVTLLVWLALGWFLVTA